MCTQAYKDTISQPKGKTQSEFYWAARPRRQVSESQSVTIVFLYSSANDEALAEDAREPAMGPELVLPSPSASLTQQQGEVTGHATNTGRGASATAHEESAPAGHAPQAVPSSPTNMDSPSLDPMVWTFLLH